MTAQQIKVNVEWLKDKDINERYYTQAVFVDGTYRVLDSWANEADIIEIENQWSRLQQLELKRCYTPEHAKWINDNEHRRLRNRSTR